LCTGTILTLILTPRAHYAAPSNRPLLLLFSVRSSAYQSAFDRIRPDTRGTPPASKGDLRPPQRRFVEFKHVIMHDSKIASHRMLLSSYQWPCPSCFCIARLRDRVAGCGKLRTNLKRARRRTVLQSGMCNIQTSGTYTNARNGAKLWSYVLSLLDGPPPTHSHPWKKTKRGDLGKEVDMLSLNTASRICRLG